MEETIIIEAKFDPKVKMYWYFQGMIVHALLFTALIGFFTLPIWLVFGLFIVGKRYDALSAQLTERSIHLKRGAWNRVEKTIPLEKIQDVSMRTGPLLNAFGLASVQIETAGGGNAQGAADMNLPGLSNAKEFRDAVLQQRERTSDRGMQSIAAPTQAPASGESVALLTDIRDSLKRIEKSLEDKG